ncbi:hypothetical protein Q31b_52900 [Novipirellula aureliae]|uniref:Uncharacterized protein n=1 Tax=Novipirellula aureliae TaxID=2527966 RepID=A0A5C6DGT3_9BACT|nr:hypothetical protein [Novipirellula aureliae]TWU35194.1 hypothetical protein Q31b_52900 [Novipirellula aureliae]
MKPANVTVTLVLTALVAVLSLGGLRVSADESSTPENTKRSTEAAWNSLLGREPESTRAILKLAETPADTIAFLAERLKPLTLTGDRLHKLLEDLQSSQDVVWRSAYQELQYFDPRLALRIDELFELDTMKHSPGRNRLAAILIGCGINNTADWKYIRLNPIGDGNFNICCSNNPDTCGANYWGEREIGLLGGKGEPKAEWTRIVRAICLLEHFGTPDAMRIIKQMSKGHPEAQATSLASAILTRNAMAEPSIAPESATTPNGIPKSIGPTR